VPKSITLGSVDFIGVRSVSFIVIFFLANWEKSVSSYRNNPTCGSTESCKLCLCVHWWVKNDEKFVESILAEKIGPTQRNTPSICTNQGEQWTCRRRVFLKRCSCRYMDGTISDEKFVVFEMRYRSYWVFFFW